VIPIVVGDFVAWAVGAIAQAGLGALTTKMLGTEQDRALRKAAKVAIQATARELTQGDENRSAKLEAQITKVFAAPGPDLPTTGQGTVLETLQAGIAAQVKDLAATVPDLTDTLSRHFMREIIIGGSLGGPLSPLAARLDNDATHLQGQRTESKIDRLTAVVLDTRALLDRSPGGPPGPVAVTLPPMIPGFTGRDDELARILDLLAPAGSAAIALAGVPGVGKTALAIAAGHAAQQQGWFSGGVLLIDLRGYEEASVKPGQALDALLRALEVPTEQLPVDGQAKAALYQSTLAGETKPVLVIADNASSEAQVRPLLPNAGPHKLLVTSHRTLAGLVGVRLVAVPFLTDQAAVSLLDAALRAADPNDDRISEHPADAARLVQVCGGLPLALQIVAAQLRANRLRSPAELADALAEPGLEQFAYDDGGGPDAPSVAAAFGLSYHALGEIPQRMFRLLSVNPGPDVSVAQAAFLSGLPLSQVYGVLSALTQAYLTEAYPTEGPGGEPRFRMHDLLRRYSEQRSDDHAEADGREAARDRLLKYYLGFAQAARQYLRPSSPWTVQPAEFSDRDAALAWLDAERQNLVASVSMAAGTGREQAALGLPLALSDYLYWKRRFDDLLATMTICLEYARRVGNREYEGIALTILGPALQAVRRFDEAVARGQEAVAMYQQPATAPAQPRRSLIGRRPKGRPLTDDQFQESAGRARSEGMALNNLSMALLAADRSDQAVTAAADAAAIFSGILDQEGEAAALNNLGMALSRGGQSGEAVPACQRAVSLAQARGDRRGEGIAMTNLGAALAGAQRVDEAIARCQEAVAICHETGDQVTEGTAQYNLGAALLLAKRVGEAVTACRDAAALLRRTDDRHAQANALTNLGAALQAAGQFTDAIAAGQEAEGRYLETNDPRGEARAQEIIQAAQSAQAAQQPGS
jgi:tetratricopeptide (TPR) repeat protein